MVQITVNCDNSVGAGLLGAGQVTVVVGIIKAISISKLSVIDSYD